LRCISAELVEPKIEKCKSETEVYYRNIVDGNVADECWEPGSLEGDKRVEYL